MRLAYWVLRPAQRSAIREIARRAYFASHGDRDRAIKDVAEDVSEVAGNVFLTILLGIAIQLAIDLINYWIENNVTAPAVTYQIGEPGIPTDEEEKK